MEILEKILEEVTQYTKDVYECDLDDIVEYQRRNKEDKCTYIVQGIEEATEFIRSHMDETISEMEKVEKEKVTSAEIITRQIDGKGTGCNYHSAGNRTSWDISILKQFRSWITRTESSCPKTASLTIRWMISAMA